MYAVQFVEDDRLSSPWALARMGDLTVLFLRGSEVSAEVLEEAWAAFRWLATNRPALPEQRAIPDVETVDPGEAMRRAVIAGHRG